MHDVALFTSQLFLQPGAYHELYEELPELRDRLAAAGSVLGTDLAAALLGTDEALLNQGTVARPIIVAMSLALYGQRPAPHRAPGLLSGLSLGQITAACAAGMMSFRDAIRMCAYMARIEEDRFGTTTYGTYFFHDIDLRTLEGMLADVADEGHTLHPCAVTADRQMIVTGDFPGLERLARDVARHDPRALGLKVPYSPPAHCALMADVGRRMRAEWTYLDPVGDPRTPLICNLSAELLRTSAEVHDALVDQYIRPVQWADVVRRAAGEGSRALLLPGPGHFIAKSLPSTTGADFSRVDQLLGADAAAVAR